MTAPPDLPPAPPVWLLFAAVGAGGAAGAVSRFAVSLAAAAWVPRAAWLGTLAANWAGCLLIGVVLHAAASEDRVGPLFRAVAVTGFLGGLTTFSTFGAEAVSLGRGDGGGPLAALHVGLNVGGGLLLVWCGGRLAAAALGR